MAASNRPALLSPLQIALVEPFPLPVSFTFPELYLAFWLLEGRDGLKVWFISVDIGFSQHQAH